MLTTVVALCCLLFAGASADPAVRKPMRAPTGGVAARAAAEARWGSDHCGPFRYLAYRASVARRARRQEERTRLLLDSIPTDIAEQVWGDAINGICPDYMAEHIEGFTRPLDYYAHKPGVGQDGKPIGYGYQGVIGYALGGFGAQNPAGRIRPGRIDADDHEVVHLRCGGNRCYFATLSETQLPNSDGSVTRANLTLEGWVGFDENDLMNVIVTTVPRMADKNYVLEDAAHAALPPYLQARLLSRTQHANLLCGNIMQNCVGPNEQYSGDQATCVAHMLSLPLGGFERADRETQMCKHIHHQLSADQPDAHCMHVGPNGGGQCRNRNLPVNPAVDPRPGADSNGIAFGPAYEDNLLALLNSRVDPNERNDGGPVCANEEED